MTNEEFIESIRLEGEEWRDVVGYEGLYIVSSYGRVASIPRVFFNGHRCHIEGRIMKSFKTPTGYHYVTLSKNGIHLNRSVHKLVAQSFLPLDSGRPHIDHLDGNKDNNHATNLHWVTRSENMNNLHTLKKLSLASTGVFNNGKSKIIVSISKDGTIMKYPSIAEACRMGYEKSCIHDCLNGTSQFHRKKRWMYLSDYESLVSMSKNSTDPSAD